MFKNIKNQDIKGELRKFMIPYVAVSEEIGICPTTLYLWLSKELTEERREKINSAIARIKEREGIE